MMTGSANIQERQPVIELTGLTKKYEALVAVDHLDLTIYKGEIFGLLGPNGAGKSTTILMMLGLTEPDSGTAKVCGIDATRFPVGAKKMVGYLPDNVGFYDHLTGLENLMYVAQLNNQPLKTARENAMRLLQRVGLADAAKKKTGKYSRGMIQRLGLADVLIKDPEIIILDEPTLGIDPRGVREFLDLIVQLSHEEGITVLLSSHHLHQVQQICDRVGLFVKGKLIAEGDIASLSNRLFSGDPYIIEAAIQAPGENGFIPLLEQELLQTEGVKSVVFSPSCALAGGMKEGLLKISCMQDLSATIAKTIVHAGVSLKGLSKKEYGLDDIYQRYFEKEEALS